MQFTFKILGKKSKLSLQLQYFKKTWTLKFLSRKAHLLCKFYIISHNYFWDSSPSLMTESFKQVQCLCIVRHQNNFVTGLSLYQSQQAIKYQHFAYISRKLQKSNENLKFQQYLSKTNFICI